MRRKRFVYTGIPASLHLRELVYSKAGLPLWTTLHFGHTGELMECLVPKPGVVIFCPDGYPDLFIRLPRYAVYIQGNPDGGNEGYET